MIYRFALDQAEFTSYYLLNNCKHNTMSLSLLVGTTVICLSCTVNTLMISYDYMIICKELSGSVVECSDLGVADSSLIGSTVMRLLARLFIHCFARIQPRKRSNMTENLFTGLEHEASTQLKQIALMSRETRCPTIWYLDKCRLR